MRPPSAHQAVMLTQPCARVQGAATSIYLASSPEAEGATSQYFADCRPQPSSRESYDAGVAARLWQVSQELTGAECDLRRAEPALAGRDANP